MKIYTIFAGVNGAGKSTFYTTLPLDMEQKRVNSDEILVSNGGDWRNNADQIKAMREAAKRINDYIKTGVSFNQETTLAGRSILGTIKKAKEQGFQVNLNYVGLRDADLACQRVGERVSKGGHGIESDVVRKRYETSLSMLKEVVPLCDKVQIYDNSSRFKCVARYEQGDWIEFDSNCKWLKDTFQDIEIKKNTIRADGQGFTHEGKNASHDTSKIVSDDKKPMSMDDYMAEIKKMKEEARNNPDKNHSLAHAKSAKGKTDR